jgi:hypothetical protein
MAIAGISKAVTQHNQYYGRVEPSTLGANRIYTAHSNYLSMVKPVELVRLVSKNYT